LLGFLFSEPNSFIGSTLRLVKSQELEKNGPTAQRSYNKKERNSKKIIRKIKGFCIDIGEIDKERL
jgi:hypothetical protein